MGHLLQSMNSLRRPLWRALAPVPPLFPGLCCAGFIVELMPLVQQLNPDALVVGSDMPVPGCNTPACLPPGDNFASFSAKSPRGNL